MNKKTNNNGSGFSLLDRPQPEGYGKEWLESLKKIPSKGPIDGISVLIFRISNEWLAFKTKGTREITDLNLIHKIPHRTTEVLLGITNVQGELRLAISLRALLGLDDDEKNSAHSLNHRIYPRMLSVGQGKDNFVFPVNEVYGIAQIQTSDLQKIPVNVSKSLASYTTGIFQFNNYNVGLLDEERIIPSINENHL